MADTVGQWHALIGCIVVDTAQEQLGGTTSHFCPDVRSGGHVTRRKRAGGWVCPPLCSSSYPPTFVPRTLLRLQSVTRTLLLLQ